MPCRRCNTHALLVDSAYVDTETDHHWPKATAVSGRIDVERLRGALDGERQARDLSWSKLAKLIGVSPSLLSRMGQGHRPDLESFAALVQWLGQPAENFMINPARADDTATQPALEAQLAPLLRARRDLTDEDKEYLSQVVTSAVSFIRAKRNKSS